MSDNADYTQSGPEVKFGVDSGDWRQEFPAELKPLTYCDHWIIWRWEENRQGKRTKVPYQPRQPNRKADTGDVHTWATFAEACSAAQHADGIGFVLTHTDYVAFDIDDCRDAVTGEIHPWATNLIARANSYTEVTVSGTGIRIIGIGTGPELHRKRPVVDGVSCEIYRKATRYIVMTGRQIGNKPFANIDAVIDATQVELDGRRDAPRPAGDRVDFDDVVKNGRYDLFKDEKGKDDRSRAVYYVMNEAVRRGSKDEEIVALLLDRDNRISEHIYDQGNPERFACQQVAKVRTKIESHLVSMNPMQRARQFHSQHFPNLHHWRGTFYEWVDTSHYVEVEVDRLKSVICHWLEPLLIRDEKGKIKPAPTNIAVVTETIAALQAIVHLDGTREAPFWIEDGIHGELIAFPNGLYDWVNDKLYDPSPNYFTMGALSFKYQTRRHRPKKWRKFLYQIFLGGNDRMAWREARAQVRLLQEIFGCVIVGDTSHQKCFALLGPRRSGKGTIEKMLEALLVPTAVAGPALSELGRDFGLSCLVGKRAAFIDEGRPSLDDQLRAAMNILKITGDSLLSFDRKNKSHWHGRLPVLLFFLSNQMPKMVDDSPALSGRFLILITRQSFYGKEDRKLFQEKLLPELVDVFHWALDGLRRLRKNERFTETETSVDARDRMAQMGSLVQTFVAELCELGEKYNVAKDELYTAYKAYVADNGRSPLTKGQFTSALEAATSGKAYAGRAGGRGDQVQAYRGIRLVDESRPKEQQPELPGTVVPFRP